ncbi:MAG: right-handed parallel beta-helix repeat-containing protein [Acidobacteriota bacterium]|nr:right-handed parallel beta-helix repeat-containing protein [Acidobacteriota bacterium]
MIAPLLAVLLMMDVRGTIHLAPGETHIDRPFENVSIIGDERGSVIVMDAGFQGSGAIKADGVDGLKLLNFGIRGNRITMKSPWYLPLKEAAFADYYPDNGIVIRNSRHITVQGIRFSRIKTFPLIVNASSDVAIDSVHIEDCGTLNSAGRNNTSGGILLEEGVSRFEVRHSSFGRIAGSAIWTHSYARSPRAADGVIRDNTIETVGRDAIQVGHATRVRVENNRGSQLGYPIDYVDVETHAVAVALDTAGNVDRSVYTNNRFTDVNGQCIDLDGFHDGEVTRNSCINAKAMEAYPALHYGIVFGNNDPGMQPTGIVIANNTLQGFAYGAVFLVGTHNRVENNRFLNINLAHCGAVPLSARCNYALDQPDLLRSGIYLSDNGGRHTVTRDNVIRGNTLQGYGIKSHCVGSAPAVNAASNMIANNVCSD